VIVDQSVVAVVEFFSTRPAERDDRLLDTMRDVVNQLGRVVERDRADVQLRHQATHDPLTNLPNRVLFRDRVEHALARLNRGQGRVGVLLVDLDGFKHTTTAWGTRLGTIS